MSRHDDIIPLKSFLQEEMALSLTERVAASLASLPPSTRLRLLAFLHFVDEPKSLLAELDFSASGDLRLILTAKQPAETMRQ